MSPKEKMVWEIREKYGLDSPRVLTAMLAIPREEFVPEEYKHLAYADNAIPIGFNQTISQPYTVAFMTDLLVDGRDTESEKVLEIGTGSGYQAAALSKLFGKVYTVEIIPQLAGNAKKILNKLGYSNVHVREGSGEWGWDRYAPFDAIISTASFESEVPEALFKQLKIGGVLVAPIGKFDLSVMTRFIKQSKSKYKKEEYDSYYFVPFVKSRNP